MTTEQPDLYDDEDDAPTEIVDGYTHCLECGCELSENSESRCIQCLSDTTHKYESYNDDMSPLNLEAEYTAIYRRLIGLADSSPNLVSFEVIQQALGSAACILDRINLLRTQRAP